MDLDFLLTLAQGSSRCGTTVDRIVEHIYGSKGWEGRDLMLEYFGDEENDFPKLYFGHLSYAEYVIDNIQQALNKHFLCSISLDNSWAYGPEGLPTFDHTFLLYQKQNEIYRIESYINEYCPRWTNDPFFLDKLYCLIISKPGVQRLKQWNNLFNVSVTEDTEEYPLSVYLTVFE